MTFSGQLRFIETIQVSVSRCTLRINLSSILAESWVEINHPNRKHCGSDGVAEAISLNLAG